MHSKSLAVEEHDSQMNISVFTSFLFNSTIKSKLTSKILATKKFHEQAETYLVDEIVAYFLLVLEPKRKGRRKESQRKNKKNR